jgi:hypothetical protein
MRILKKYTFCTQFLRNEIVWTDFQFTTHAPCIAAHDIQPNCRPDVYSPVPFSWLTCSHLRSLHAVHLLNLRQKDLHSDANIVVPCLFYHKTPSFRGHQFSCSPCVLRDIIKHEQESGMDRLPNVTRQEKVQPWKDPQNEVQPPSERCEAGKGPALKRTSGLQVHGKGLEKMT